ncbi:MAG: hypothetical protein LBT80_07410 [Lactobacillaceae bacterium]|jgi:hypothetical protein|nr:hypothetical protein [Lactobacillaceae bacterium]
MIKKITTVLALTAVTAAAATSLVGVKASACEGHWEYKETVKEVTAFSHTSDDYFHFNPANAYATTFDYISGIDKNQKGEITNKNQFGKYYQLNCTATGASRGEWTGVYRPYNVHDGAEYNIPVSRWVSIKQFDGPFMKNLDGNNYNELQLVDDLIQKGTISADDYVTIRPYTNTTPALAKDGYTAGWEKVINHKYGQYTWVSTSTSWDCKSWSYKTKETGRTTYPEFYIKTDSSNYQLPNIHPDTENAIVKNFATEKDYLNFFPNPDHK